MKEIALASIPFAVIGGLGLGIFLGYVTASLIQGVLRRMKSEAESLS